MEKHSKSNKNAVVLFSGGQDSTVCLFWARKNFESVTAFSIDYGQLHIKELECAKAICKEYGIVQKELKIDGSIFGQSDLLPASSKQPKNSSKSAAPATTVEGRNLVFLTLAAIFAKKNDISNLVIGVSEVDNSGYHDCSSEFIKSAEKTISLALNYNIKIHTPLIRLTKAQIWNFCKELNIFDLVKEKTLTCYNGIIGDGCKECAACKLRNNGLKNL